MNEWIGMAEQMKIWMQKAGEEQIRRLKRPMEMKSKTSDIDLVTEVDVWTEQFLIEQIKTTYPTHQILTEETRSRSSDSFIFRCSTKCMKL